LQAVGRQLESLMRSPVRIFDPAFRYVPSWATDIRKTFERASRHASAREAGSQTVVPPRTHGSSVHQVEIQAGCVARLES
jgi:hypothetical protein